MSSIGYVQVAPAGVPPEVATYLAARGAAWCDYTACGAPAKYRETPAALLPLEGWAEIIGELKSKHGFELLLDHSAVDYPARKPRFTVAAVLENPTTMVRLLLKTRVEEDAPVPTLTHLFRSADWAERETFDMFGIPFAGHPDLTRIYMPEDYEGWPMRRDFPLEGHLKFRD